MVFLGHLFKKFLCKLVKCFFINGSQHFTFSFSLYTKIPFKYQVLMYRANLRFTCLLLTMCTRMKAFCHCCPLQLQFNLTIFSKLLKMFNISWIFLFYSLFGNINFVLFRSKHLQLSSFGHFFKTLTSIQNEQTLSTYHSF